MNWIWKSKSSGARSAAPSSPEVAPPLSSPASRASASSSKLVRKLAHRRPLPRSFVGRALYYMESMPRLPRTVLASVGFVVLAIVFFQFLAESEYFALREIRIDGAGRVSEQSIRACLAAEGIQPGVSTMAIRSAHVEEVLRKIPEIQDAIAEVFWPDRVQVSLVERAPAGIYVSQNASTLYDHDGFLFSPALSADFARPDLPLLTGFSAAKLQPGQSIPPQALGHVDLFRSVVAASMPSLAHDISEINYDENDGLTLILNDGIRLSCGWRKAQDVGPVIESLLRDPDSRSTLESATLFSAAYISVKRRPIVATGASSHQIASR